ncbi:unnamed protein product [Vicia faba]|uniref:Uncharacterized protein n=1 Tax=Vicia faba TaxID=3906 RepID=A0AAV1ASV1_VICFA|nr:unnamed protein product [Vicia faba]
MAVTAISETSQIHRFPQYKYIHAVRWLPVLSAFNRFAVLASSNSDSDVSSIEIHSFKPNPISFDLHSSWASPSPIFSLKASQFLQKSVIAASTSSGSLHFLFADSSDRMLEYEVSVPEHELHSVGKSCIDLIDGGIECVTVGDDGKVNLVTVGDSNLNYRRLFDSDGLVSYTAVKWASPVEFATGGYGFGLQWWDQRKPGDPVSQFKGNWDTKLTSGIVHSINIHPSRKHTCLAGGSLGTVLAWDLRWQQQPIILSGAGNGAGNTAVQSISESEVNLVSVGDSNLNYRRLFDSDGLVSYTAVKWASPVEFSTGGYGFGLQWWDQRKPGHPREKEKREPTQSEMFVETRKGNKGKELDVETGKSQLQEMVEKEESDTEAFKVFFLERSFQAGEQVSTLRDEFQDKIDRLQNAFKTVIQQCNPQINIESIEDLLGLSHGDANSSPKDIRPQMHSSTSTHAPSHGKQCINEDVEKDDINDEIQEDDINDKIQEDDLNDKIQEDDVDDEFQEDDIDLDDEFQEEDIDGEFQEDDVDEEFMEDDISNEFQEDDLDALLLEDKLE